MGKKNDDITENYKKPENINQSVKITIRNPKIIRKQINNKKIRINFSYEKELVKFSDLSILENNKKSIFRI